MRRKQKIIVTIAFLLAIFCGAATNTPWDGTNWDVTAPNIDQPIGNHYKEIFDLRKGIAIRMNKEHETLATASAGGVHLQGSARVFYQSGAPATRVDGSPFTSADLGSLWFGTSGANATRFNILTATTPSWTSLPDDIISYLLSTNRQFTGTLGCDGNFTSTGLITANSGVTLGSGDDLIGSVTSAINMQAFDVDEFGVGTIGTSFNIAGTIAVVGTIDDDTMAAATDTTVSTSESIKAYVDLDSTGSLMHDAEGSFRNCDVNGTKTRVYTKYFTGTTDADSETSVAHGIAGGDAKILSCNAIIENSSSSYFVGEQFESADGNNSFSAQFNATNVVFSGIGSNFQSQAYHIKLDYIL